MLKIAICCGGGFSSSALASHLEKESTEKNLKERAEFVFIPISHLIEKMDEVDIAMVCPHSEYVVRKNAPLYTIPVTVIPPRLYGLMPAIAFIEDAEDLYELWKNGIKNMVTFPDEPHSLAVKRTTSHRRHVNGEKTDFSTIR